MTSKRNYKTEWDLTLFYKNDKDPQIQKDIESSQKAILSFAKKYRNKDFTKDSQTLRKALRDYENLLTVNGLNRVMSYYWIRKELNSMDTVAETALVKFSALSAELSNHLTFFNLVLGAIPPKKQVGFLKDTTLAHYKYFLEIIFNNAQFNLSEPEEKIMNLKSLPAHGLWTSGFKRIVGKQTIMFKGKEMPLAEASSSYFKFKKNDRRLLYKKIMETLYNISDYAESEMNAVVTNKKIDDELRGYKTPFEATVRGYENKTETVDALRVSVKQFNKTSHRFYKIKARMLGEKTLMSADRNTPVGTVKKKITFDQAIDIVHAELNKADTRFGDIFQNMLTRGQIDVYPKKGKRGGAFCYSEHALPTLVFLNHTDDFNSVDTLAHEMGHAIHAEFSKQQGVLYEDHTIATAEVASTFFEALIFDAILFKATDKERAILLHDKIHNDIMTIFRQMACFEFEVELHNTIRDKGFLPKEDIARLMNKHMKAYLGPVFTLEDIDGYMFVNWPHIRNFFYVYSYAFGQIVSAAMYAKYKEDPTFIDKVIEFLSAGGSDSPENIFKSIGIDVTKPDFFETGLKQIDKQVKELERLVGK